MKHALQVTCAAKVNLFLDVRKRRPDGYHDVVTVMQTIGLYDDLELTSQQKGFGFTCDHPDVPEDDRNLVWKAAQTLAESACVPCSAQVILQKNIPVAAGLGGGSADAAGTLAGLKRLWQLKHKRHDLNLIAQNLGADVPFLLRGGCGLAKGIGDQWSPIQRRIPLWFVLAKPALKVSTPWAYNRWDEVGMPLNASATEICNALIEGDLTQIGNLLANAFEPVIFQAHPEIQILKHKLLDAGALGAVLSGTGPTVVGLFENRRAAKRASETLSSFYGWTAFAPAVSHSLTLRRKT